MKFHRLSLVAMLGTALFAGGCSTAKFQASKVISQDGIEASIPSNPTSVDAAAALEAEWSRGYTPTNDSEVSATLLTEDLIRARFAKKAAAAGLTSSASYQEELSRTLRSEVTERTCFEFKGSEKTSFYFGGLTFQPEKWKGVLLTGSSPDALRLHFDTQEIFACTNKAVPIRDGVSIIIQTQFDASSRHPGGQLKWKADEAQKFAFEMDPFIPQGSVQELFDKTSKETAKHVLGDGMESAQMKVIAAAVATRKTKYLEEALPWNAPVSKTDRIKLGIWAVVLAKKHHDKCPVLMVDRMLRLSGLGAEDLYYGDKYDSHNEKYGYQCAPMARFLYKWVPAKRSEIAQEINNSLVSDVDSALSFDPSNDFAQSLLQRLTLLKQIHRDWSKECLQGEKDKCIIAERYAENLSTFRKAEAKLTQASRKQRLFGDVLKAYKDFEVQESQRRKKRNELLI